MPCSPIPASPSPAALQLLPLVFVMPSELRLATWDESKLDGKEPQWVIPAARMKVKDRGDHIVPLSTQAVAILKELRRHGDSELVFPSLRPNRPISENTMNLALRTLGYDGEVQVPHPLSPVAALNRAAILQPSCCAQVLPQRESVLVQRALDRRHPSQQLPYCRLREP